jgi:hypothetical protein
MNRHCERSVPEATAGQPIQGGPLDPRLLRRFASRNDE